VSRSARRHFQPTVRLRLTLLYGGVFLAVGAALLVVNYVLVRRSLSVQPSVLQQRIEIKLGHSLFSFPAPPLSAYRRLEALLRDAADGLRSDALHALVVQSILAFAGLAVLCFGLGWLVAGRALRPLKTITGTARRLSGDTLHERIDLQGPSDELKELADTFDEMLARLDAAFDSQRRFVANASHELRTPLSIIRTELDVTLANPEPTREEFEAMASVVRTATDRSDRLIDSLLTLARTEGGVSIGGQEVDLRTLAARVLARFEPQAAERSIRLERSLAPAVARGDEVLLERLLENLVENAIRYDGPGGWVEVTTGPGEHGARLRVRNGGDGTRVADVEALFEPFRRGEHRDRVRSDRGVGLGLAIVRAVAQAHGGSVRAEAPEGGGLDVCVELPAAVPSDRVVARHGA
jgi:signal transduction histidine kinase